MALGYKARRRLSLLILLVGLPVYVILAVTILNWLERPSFLVELLVYVILGIAWALPFRFIFLGIGKAEPETSAPQTETNSEEGDGSAF